MRWRGCRAIHRTRILQILWMVLRTVSIHSSQFSSHRLCLRAVEGREFHQIVRTDIAGSIDWNSWPTNTHLFLAVRSQCIVVSHGNIRDVFSVASSPLPFWGDGLGDWSARSMSRWSGSSDNHRLVAKRLHSWMKINAVGESLRLALKPSCKGGVCNPLNLVVEGIWLKPIKTNQNTEKPTRKKLCSSQKHQNSHQSYTCFVQSVFAFLAPPLAHTFGLPWLLFRYSTERKVFAWVRNIIRSAFISMTPVSNSGSSPSSRGSK